MLAVVELSHLSKKELVELVKVQQDLHLCQVAVFVSDQVQETTVRKLIKK